MVLAGSGGVGFLLWQVKRRPQQAIRVWKNALAIVMLGAAMGGISEEGYYTLLRIVIFLLAGGAAFRWFFGGRPVLLWLFIGMAIMFNPIIEIHFEKEIWMGIDAVAVILFGIDGYLKRNVIGVSKSSWGVTPLVRAGGYPSL